MSETEQETDKLDGRNASLEVAFTTLLSHLAEANGINSQRIKQSLTEQRDAKHLKFLQLFDKK